MIIGKINYPKKNIMLHDVAEQSHHLQENIINIINNKEVIPELLQGECNAKEIFNSVNYLLNHPDLISRISKKYGKSEIENFYCH